MSRTEGSTPRCREKDSQRVAELIEGGCTLEDLTRLGFRPAALKAQNSILELKCAGFSAAELKAAYCLRGLRRASFRVGELKEFSVAELKSAGFSAAQ